jgi:hypothetical protein
MCDSIIKFTLYRILYYFSNQRNTCVEALCSGGKLEDMPFTCLALTV